eukprot:1621248-Pyramimonas_sp.AAC.1
MLVLLGDPLAQTLRATGWTLRVVLWTLRVLWWMLRAILWMLRATGFLLPDEEHRLAGLPLADDDLVLEEHRRAHQRHDGRD